MRGRELLLTAGDPRAEPRRFYGSIALDPIRMSRDAGQVADEVVKHLVAQVGSEVAVRVEITATSEDGFPEDVVRTVTENARTLKFDQHGFEREEATAAQGDRVRSRTTSCGPSICRHRMLRGIRRLPSSR